MKVFCCMLIIALLISVYQINKLDNKLDEVIANHNASLVVLKKLGEGQIALKKLTSRLAINSLNR